jgi:D-serine deaminase-like pyridoxal phosphate-dependent protein
MENEPLKFPAFLIPDSVETPATCVVEPTMQSNIDAMVKALGTRGVTCRPHTKSHKSLEIGRRQIAAGCVGLTTATIGEAEVFVNGGINDVLIAYPIWFTPEKARRISALLELATITVGVSSLAGAHNVVRLLRGNSLHVSVEVSCGEIRTGVATATEAVAVANVIRDGGLKVVGVFAHGGHSYAGGTMIQTAADEESNALLSSSEALRNEGYDVMMASAGSTPTALLSAVPGVTEERPGTYVFGDRQQSTIGAHRPQDVALFVAGTVVQVSDPYFVVDVGAKMLTKDLPKTVEGYGALPAYPSAIIERLYDHHGVIHSRGGGVPREGERLAVIPNHVCPITNLSREFVALDDDGRETSRWPIDAGLRNT